MEWERLCVGNGGAGGVAGEGGCEEGVKVGVVGGCGYEESKTRRVGVGEYVGCGGSIPVDSE